MAKNRRPIRKKIQSRYEDNGELLWAIRSIEKNINWVRKIHIISDKQTPSWIKKDHPKIHFVDHDTIFYPGFHSFNSISIHFSMNRIPGVSRRIILLDDDTFIMQPLTPDYFFQSNNKTRIFSTLDEKMRKESSKNYFCVDKSGSLIYNLGMLLAREKVQSIFKNDNLSFAISLHSPIPVDIQVLNEILFHVDVSFTLTYPFSDK